MEREESGNSPMMNKHEDVAKALKARLSDLTGRVAEIA
jgi:hypothetical protein